MTESRTPDKPKRTVEKPKPKPRPINHAWRPTGIVIPDKRGDAYAGVRDFICMRCKERRGVVEGLSADVMKQLLQDMSCRCRP
jgi:hypothetical protein